MSFPGALTLSACSFLSLLAVSGTAHAGGEAKVSARIAELRVSPSDEARTRIKLGAGRSVTVLGTSDDGGWVKIRGQMERGEDKITFEGWVDATELSGNFAGAKKMQESEVADTSGKGKGGDNWDFGDDAAKADESVAKTSEPEAWESEGDAAPAASSNSEAGADWGDDASTTSSSSDAAESTDGW